MDPETTPLPGESQDRPGKGCAVVNTFLAAMIFPVVFVIAGIWMVGRIRIPTGQDAEKVFRFHSALEEQLGRKGLTNLEIYAKPWPGGRGDIILYSSLPPEKLEVVRQEFDRLNVNGAYELKVRAPRPAAVPPAKEQGAPSGPRPSNPPAGSP